MLVFVCLLIIIAARSQWAAFFLLKYNKSKKNYFRTKNIINLANNQI